MTLAFGSASALLRRAQVRRLGDASLLMAASGQNNNMVRIDSADRRIHLSLGGCPAHGRRPAYAEQAKLRPQIRPPGTVSVYHLRTYAPHAFVYPSRAAAGAPAPSSARSG